MNKLKFLNYCVAAWLLINGTVGLIFAGCWFAAHFPNAFGVIVTVTASVICAVILGSFFMAFDE